MSRGAADVAIVPRVPSSSSSLLPPLLLLPLDFLLALAASLGFLLLALALALALAFGAAFALDAAFAFVPAGFAAGAFARFAAPAFVALPPP